MSVLGITAPRRQVDWRAIGGQVLSGISGFLITLFLAAVSAVAAPAPPGPGCSNANAGALNISCPNGPSLCTSIGTFQAGETLTFNLTVTLGPINIVLQSSGGSTTVISGATASTTASFAISADASYTIRFEKASGGSGSLALSCAPANALGSQNIRHQVANHWSAIIGIYGEHRTPLPFQTDTPDDGFQDGTGTGNAIDGNDNGFSVQASVRGLLAARQSHIEPAAAITPKPQSWDLWIKGIYTDYENDDTRTKGETYVLSTGLDYLLRDDLLVGLIGGVDGGDQSSGTLVNSAKVSGFIIGPYASLRLNKQLTLYGRAAWGRATHSMRDGTLSAKTKSDRIMLVGSLKGTYWNLFPVRLTPNIAFHYVNEKLKGFTDSAGNSIGSTRVELGRMELGGEIGHRSTLDNGYIFDPYLGLHLLWDFVNEGNLQLATNISAKQSDLRGRISGGFILQTGQNSHINLAVQYDGLGSGDFEAFSAHARFVLPLD